MTKRKFWSKGSTLAELMAAVFTFGIIMDASVQFFVLSQGYFFTGSAQVDTLSASQQSVKHLAAELMETSSSSVKFSTNHDAIVFISARNLSGKFQISSALPNWQKWVCYYLKSDPNGPYSLLIRKESATLFSGLPSTSHQTAPSNWLTQFQAFTGNQSTVGSGIQTFDVEDLSCNSSPASPYYVQVISTVSYRGKLTNYNPGYSVAWSGCSKTGNWVQAQVVNQ